MNTYLGCFDRVWETILSILVNFEDLLELLLCDSSHIYLFINSNY